MAIILTLLMALISVGAPQAHASQTRGNTLSAVKSGHAQVVRLRIPEAKYQGEFNKWVRAGYQLEWIDAFDVKGAAYFNVVFVPKKGTPWRAFHGLTGSQYQELFDEMVKDERYRPTQVDSYLSGSRVRYAGTFEKIPGGAFHAYHGSTTSNHQKKFDELTRKGYRPTSLSVVSVAGSLRYTAVYERGLPGSFWVKSQLTPAQYQKAFDEQKSLDRRPVYLNGYTHKGSPRLVAIFSSEPENEFRARHGLTSTQFMAAEQAAKAAKFRTDVVTGYGVGSSARYAAVWTR